MVVLVPTVPRHNLRCTLFKIQPRVHCMSGCSLQRCLFVCRLSAVRRSSALRHSTAAEEDQTHEIVPDVVPQVVPAVWK